MCYIYLFYLFLSLSLSLSLSLFSSNLTTYTTSILFILEQVLLTLENNKLRAKVADFGLARLIDDLSPKRKAVSQAKHFKLERHTSKKMTSGKGTCLWMAPELVKNMRSTVTEYSQAVDLYSFGIICYECLERKEPWAGEYTFSYMVFKAVSSGKRPKISANLANEAPEGFVKLMKSCWQQNAMARPKFKDVLHSLQDIYFKEYVGRRSVAEDKRRGNTFGVDSDLKQTQSLNDPENKNTEIKRRKSSSDHIGTTTSKSNNSRSPTNRFSRSLGSILAAASRRSSKASFDLSSPSSVSCENAGNNSGDIELGQI